MADKEFTVLDLLDLNLHGLNVLNLRCISGRKGLGRKILIPDLNRPGLVLSGFYENFAFDRIQLFGRGEVAYLEKLFSENKAENVYKLFSYEIPCCVFTRSLTPPQQFIDIADGANCAILQTDLDSSEFSTRMLRVLSNLFAPKKTMHGVLLEVYGLGIIILGDSGVGKSETALELIERGHRLVADDILELRCINGSSIVGRGSNDIIGHHMEIRGLGIINIVQLFGVGAIRNQKEVQLIVRLEEWDNNKVYDRIGTENHTMDVLGVQIPYLRIPIKPGRNIPIIIETAAMNERLKQMGYFSAKEFNQNVLKWIESGEARSLYYDNEDIY